ncbi:MAG: TatD family hydrolase, partial [Pseudomonadales bacterium]|nr:TatD family hydrolase [Pseudomonadales bacterium]
NMKTVIDIAEQNRDVFASVGLHPMEFNPGENQQSLLCEDELALAASHSSVVAVGETGLDYYYSDQGRDLQVESFLRHLRVSRALKKPVVVHTRDAADDTVSCIKQEHDPDVAGVFHCFTGDWALAQQALELNYMISFSGIITFKNAGDLRDVVKKVPLDRLLVETDSPYLAPVPYRGKSNEPAYVVEVAQCVAALKGISFEQVVEQTGENFRQLFRVHGYGK